VHHDREGAGVGQSVDFHGTPGKLTYTTARRIPGSCGVGAEGHRAGREIADGVLLLSASTTGSSISRPRASRARGKRAGRRLDDLEIVWAVRTGTAASTAEARRLARPTAVHWGIHALGRHWLERPAVKFRSRDSPTPCGRSIPIFARPRLEAAIAPTPSCPTTSSPSCARLWGSSARGRLRDRIVTMTKLGIRNLYLMPLLTSPP